MFGWLKRLCGINPETEVTQEDIDAKFSKDIGPAKPWYLKRLMRQYGVKSAMTKKLTPARRKRMRDLLRSLRPEQLRIMRAKGWDKGVAL